MVCWLEGLESTDSELLFILQNVLRKVQHQDALQISDVVMASLLRMFQSTAGSGGVQEDALMAVSTLVEGQWAAIRQGNFFRVQESFSSHEEFLTAKSIVLLFTYWILSQFRVGLNISINLCITALPLSLKWMGANLQVRLAALCGVEGTVIYLMFLGFLFPLKLNLLYWTLTPVKDGGSKSLCFLSWHLVPSGLGFNVLDLGVRQYGA